MVRRMAVSAPRVMLFGIALLGVVVTTTARMWAPEGLNTVLPQVWMVACSGILAAWPHLVGAKPRWLWTVLSVASACLFLAWATEPSMVMVGVFELSDLFFLTAYVGCAAWLVALARRIMGDRKVWRAILDACSAALGAAIVLWTLTQIYGEDVSARTAILGAYPLLDMVAVILSGHLLLRIRRQMPAWIWVFSGASLLLVLDGLLFLAALTRQEQWTPTVRVGYPIVYLMLGLVVFHPGIRNLPFMTATANQPTTRAPAGSLVMLGVLLAVVSLGISGHARPEELLGHGLVAGLLSLVFIRLFVTLRELATSEAESRRQASLDPLTGLINRGAFIDALVQRLAEDHAVGARTALLRLNCDGFRGVNDRWGPRPADVLLKRIAERLDEAVDDAHILARHGGDEFLVVCTVSGEQEAIDFAHELMGLFNTPFTVQGRLTQRVSACVGVAITPVTYDLDRAKLMLCSDAALQEAKARGRSQVALYDEDLDQRLSTHAALSDALRAALDDGRITVAFQPIHGGDGFERLVGWEALARWNDPDLGVVPPSTFVAVAEKEGMICDLGEAMLRRSLLEFARLRWALGDDTLTLSVNVSATQLYDYGFRELVDDALNSAGVPARCLRLEITESILVGDEALPIAVLEDLQARGVTLALDDFGTGYASMATLRRLPLSCLKLDRSLITPLGQEPEATAQVKAVLDFVESLGIGCIVAEGVENVEQVRILEDLGCPMVQGWLFGRPTPCEDILALVPTGGRDLMPPLSSHPSGGGGPRIAREVTSSADQRRV